MPDYEIERVYYEHDADCSTKDFTELSPNGLKTCVDCAGVFDADGKGVSTTSKKFDGSVEDV